MKNKRILTALMLSLFTVFYISCSDDNDTDNTEEFILEEAKLTAFPLLGITPTSVEIIQPVIENNTEIEYGKINIVVSDPLFLPHIVPNITSNELNLSKFAIIPGGNTALSYESQSHTHTIVNALNESQELLHYVVTIEAETPPTPSSLTVTDFKFEASKNAQLTEDVTIERVFNDPNSNSSTIYLFVPEGTDFSDLTPTATFDAEDVFYTQDASIPTVDVDTPFPTTETSFDFSYPKIFTIVLKDDSNNRMKWVNVFVDIKNPMQLVDNHVNTGDIDRDVSVNTFTGITHWKNIGNHSIELQSANTYENIIPENMQNAVTAHRIFPVGGLKPGESADVNVLVVGNLPVFEYKTTAIFYSQFVGQETINDMVEPVKLNITANVIN